MGRERRPYTRTSEVRDAKLLVIATEGQKTEYDYFSGLSASLLSEPTRLHIKLLERNESNSSPRYIIGLIDKFVAKNAIALNEGDELWLVIDRDKQSWSEEEISEVAQQCMQKDYGLALSNPCFELWLLLHGRDVAAFYTEEEKQALFENKKVSSKRTLLKKEVSAVMAGYNPSKIVIEDFIPLLESAIQRAKSLDTNPNHRWPISLGTRVYLLVEKILTYK